ncbi:MAG TPA: hypothetical protein VGD81_13455 [Opitutaceae bacterium]
MGRCLSAKRLISALKKNQIPHEVFLVGGEGHGMARFTSRVELYRRIEAFLAENLAPAPAKLRAVTRRCR